MVDSAVFRLQHQRIFLRLFNKNEEGFLFGFRLSTKRFNNFEIWLWIPSSSKAPLFNVSYKAQNSTQDDTANQFNDAGEVLDNPFIVEDNKGTESLKDIH